jgi:aerobic carbon-monoxide dehydrogenase small subunit
MAIVAEKAHSISLVVNGTATELEIPPQRLLSDVLREDLGLTGTHVGCGTGECGSCTVIVDGEPVRSCLSLAVQADGTTVETIEGIGKAGALHPVQQAFHDHHALQCGFCTPGIVVAAVALLRSNKSPTDEDLAKLLQGHLCRCTGYSNIAEALHSVAKAGGR